MPTLETLLYVAACLAVPIAWGTVVHLLFAWWHAHRKRRRSRFAEDVEEQAVP